MKLASLGSRIMLGCSFIALTAAVAGCGNGPAPSSTPTPTPPPTPTPTPGAAITAYFSQAGTVTVVGGNRSAPAFGASAPAGFGANRNPGSTAIASSITIGTPGGVITLSHVNTITEQTWLGQGHAVISGYNVTQSTDSAINTTDGVGHVLNLAVTSNLTYTELWRLDDRRQCGRRHSELRRGLCRRQAGLGRNGRGQRPRGGHRGL